MIRPTATVMSKGDLSDMNNPYCLGAVAERNTANFKGPTSLI